MFSKQGIQSILAFELQLVLPLAEDGYRHNVLNLAPDQEDP